MTTKKFLSEKKVSQQTISISPALKEWIERYVRVMHKKNPEDNRYKSISAFICNIMENVLKIFKKGKSLDDFDNIVDKKIQNFYDKLTFRAVIPYYEEVVYLNKYQNYSYTNMLNLFMMYRNQFIGKNELTIDKLIDSLNRFRLFMASNNVTKDINYEFSQKKFILHYFGIYPNIHYDFSKWIAGFLGVLGFKIKKYIYSKNYTRFDLERTFLLKDSNPLVNERTELFYENLNKFTSYYNAINDEDSIHLWMKLLENKNTIISFKDQNKGLALIDKIIKDIKIHSIFSEKNQKFLKFFEHFKWIEIMDLEECSFMCNLSNEHIFEKEILKNIFEKLEINIIKKKEIYYIT